METKGTIFYRNPTSPDTIWQAIKALAEGLDIQATARVFEVQPDIVQNWLEQASKHMEIVSRYMLYDLHLTQVQVLISCTNIRDELAYQADCHSHDGKQTCSSFAT